ASPTEALPVAPFGSIEVDPETLTFAADPAVSNRDLTSGLIVVRVATNAANGFVLRLVSDALQIRTGQHVTSHTPRLSVAEPGVQQQVFDLTALGSQGIVVADWPHPVPDGQQLEFRLLVSTEVDFTTAADSYATRLRLDFEPRY
ncbi:MAG: hypothetical protein JOY61_04805, partial [Chloroflexi bacterium]|nr:hypothetical protein [Chloroflexota bacterium]